MVAHSWEKSIGAQCFKEWIIHRMDPKIFMLLFFIFFYEVWVWKTLWHIFDCLEKLYSNWENKLFVIIHIMSIVLEDSVWNCVFESRWCYGCQCYIDIVKCDLKNHFINKMFNPKDYRKCHFFFIVAYFVIFYSWNSYVIFFAASYAYISYAN